MDPYMSRLGTGIFYQTGINTVMDEIAILAATTGDKHISITEGLLNPYGSQSEFGSDNGTDAQGSATVGGINTPPLTDRTGMPAGKGTALSDMSSNQLNNNTGTDLPPDPGLLGKSGDCDC
jgi:hypothetical protein